MFAFERSGPVRVGDVLVAALPELRERLLEQALRAEWNRLVGTELGRRSRPRGLRAGVLEVIADNSTWLHELTLRSGDLLAAIRLRFESVTALRISLGALPPVAGEAPAPPRPERPRRLSHEELRVVEATVAALPDPMLAGPLRRLLTKDLLARRRKDLSARPEDSRPVEREDP